MKDSHKHFRPLFDPIDFAVDAFNCYLSTCGRS